MNFLYQNDLPEDISLGDEIAIDTETTGLNLHRDKLCVVQISDGNGDAHLVQFQDDNYCAPNLKKILSNDNIIKIFHYARFDLAILKIFFDINLQNIYCTKISSKLCRTYSESHGLKTLLSELLSIEISKKQQSSYWRGQLSKEQISYAAQDVLYLHKIKEKLDFMLKNENRLSLAKECFSFLRTRVELDIIGFGGDQIFRH
jgi:ribonuclease D